MYYCTSTTHACTNAPDPPSPTFFPSGQTEAEAGPTVFFLPPSEEEAEEEEEEQSSLAAFVWPTLDDSTKLF